MLFSHLFPFIYLRIEFTFDAFRIDSVESIRKVENKIPEIIYLYFE